MKPNCLCYNGGTCTTEGGCNYPATYGGPACEHTRRRLRILVRRGENLLNVDMTNNGQNKSDPMIYVTATDHNGGRRLAFSNVTKDSLNPQWNQWLDFGVNEWGWFSLQALDYTTQELSHALIHVYSVYSR